MNLLSNGVEGKRISYITKINEVKEMKLRRKPILLFHLLYLLTSGTNSFIQYDFFTVSVNITIAKEHITLCVTFYPFSKISGKVGGLTDLTGAAAANGLLVGITGDHAEASKHMNGIYGSHIGNIAPSYNSADQGKKI